MVKQVISFAANDGTRFDTELEAAVYDAKLEVKNAFVSQDVYSSDEVAMILTENALTFFPALKAVFDARNRVINPNAPQAVIVQAAPQPQQNQRRVFNQPPPEGGPSGGGLQRGGTTGWSVYEEDGQWWASNGKEKGGPFARRGEAVDFFRKKEQAARV